MADNENREHYEDQVFEEITEDTEEISEEEDSEEIPEEKYKKKKSNVWIPVIFIILLLIGFGTVMTMYQNTQLEKCFYQIQSNKVVDNMRIVAISDLHLKEFGENNERLVAEINNLSPDIIAVVGDMNMESEPDNYGVVITLMKELNKVAPVYYSLGNHEIDSMLFKNSKIYKDVKAADIKIFNNEMETLNVNGNIVDVIGLTQNPEQFHEHGQKFFDKVMNENPSNFKLVLTHYPENFQGVLDDYYIDLALSGHAHGGQVRLPLIGGLYSADQGILPELCDGEHDIGNSKLIITRGLGKSGLVPRINNKPEITIVDVGWY